VGNDAPADPADAESPNTGRTGVLVIRAWQEDNSETGLRIRITQILDISHPSETVTLATTSDEAEAAVHSWLEAFTAG
jgi:hypothetical protein